MLKFKNDILIKKNNARQLLVPLKKPLKILPKNWEDIKGLNSEFEVENMFRYLIRKYGPEETKGNKITINRLYGKPGDKYYNDHYQKPTREWAQVNYQKHNNIEIDYSRLLTHHDFPLLFKLQAIIHEIAHLYDRNALHDKTLKTSKKWFKDTLKHSDETMHHTHNFANKHNELLKQILNIDHPALQEKGANTFEEHLNNQKVHYPFIWRRNHFLDYFLVHKFDPNIVKENKTYLDAHVDLSEKQYVNYAKHRLQYMKNLIKQHRYGEHQNLLLNFIENEYKNDFKRMIRHKLRTRGWQHEKHLNRIKQNIKTLGKLWNENSDKIIKK